MHILFIVFKNLRKWLDDILTDANTCKVKEFGHVLFSARQHIAQSKIYIKYTFSVNSFGIAGREVREGIRPPVHVYTDSQILSANLF